MSRRAYHHGDLRAALLDEASNVIAREGAERLTMRGLCQRLGVSRAAPYRHFADKQALLVAVAAAGFARLGAVISDVGAGRPDAGLTRLRGLGEAYVRFALENPGHYRLMYGKEAITRDEVPELRAAADELFASLVAVFRAHQVAGTLRPEPPETQAYVAWSAVHGLSLLLLDGQIRPDDVDALIRQTTRTTLAGMLRSKSG